jgi:hypothetical protein
MTDHQKRQHRQNVFSSVPDDLTHDPRYAVPVSRQGIDHGAVLRDTELVEVEDPHRESGVIVAQRVRSGLSRMLKRGDISPGMAEVGARFQKHFDVCGYCHVTTVNLSGAGGGGSGGVEEALTRSVTSRKIVHHLLLATGWPDALPGKAAWWVIGHGMGLDEIAQRRDLHSFRGETDSRYWKGAVVTALQLMEREWRGWQVDAKSRGPKMRGQRHFSPDELTVREGVIPRP